MTSFFAILGIPSCFPQPGSFLVQFNESLTITFYALVLRSWVVIYKDEQDTRFILKKLIVMGKSGK